MFLIDPGSQKARFLAVWRTPSSPYCSAVAARQQDGGRVWTEIELGSVPVDCLGRLDRLVVSPHEAG